MPYNSDFLTREQERDRHFNFKFAYQSLKTHYEEIKSQLDEIKEYIKLNADSHEISAPFELKKTIKNILDENKKLRVENRKSTIEIQKLNDKINQLTDRVSELETTINRKNKEIITFEKHNILMSELLDERKSGWITRRDLAIRTNPVPDEKNEFGYPLNFDEEKAHKLHSNEENSECCHFKYYPQGDFPDGKYNEYDMPWSLYEFLSERIPKNITETKAITNREEMKKSPTPSLLVIRDENEFEKHIESYGKCPSDFRELHAVYIFLDENRERTFPRKLFGKKCSISPRTVSRYLELLLKCDLIIKLQGRGKHKVNIKETKSE